MAWALGLLVVLWVGYALLGGRWRIEPRLAGDLPRPPARRNGGRGGAGAERGRRAAADAPGAARAVPTGSARRPRRRPFDRRHARRGPAHRRGVWCDRATDRAGRAHAADRLDRQGLGAASGRTRRDRARRRLDLAHRRRHPSRAGRARPPDRRPRTATAATSSRSWRACVARPRRRSSSSRPSRTSSP